MSLAERLNRKLTVQRVKHKRNDTVDLAIRAINEKGGKEQKSEGSERLDKNPAAVHSLNSLLQTFDDLRKEAMCQLVVWKKGKKDLSGKWQKRTLLVNRDATASYFAAGLLSTALKGVISLSSSNIERLTPEAARKQFGASKKTSSFCLRVVETCGNERTYLLAFDERSVFFQFLEMCVLCKSTLSGFTTDIMVEWNDLVQRRSELKKKYLPHKRKNKNKKSSEQKN